VHRILLCELAFVVGCLPPDEPQKPRPVADPDITQLAHTWKVIDHVLATKTNLSERDAAELRGRTVAVGPASYTTPWQGTCEQASREKRTRALGDIARELDLSDAARDTVKAFGLGDSIAEFRLSCQDYKTRTPALTIYVGNAHAMTCFSGACYLLKP
jgi:hypothetical protein